MMLEKLRIRSALVVVVLLTLASCRDVTPVKSGPESTSLENMLNTDIAFSEMSRQVGMKKAFIEYISNEGILLRPGHLPIRGADAIDFLSQLSDTSYRLTWRPSDGQVSKSGDLGFTYGVYELSMADTVYRGTYVSIWKKQRDGTWKFVLDSGNEGIHLVSP